MLMTPTTTTLEQLMLERHIRLGLETNAGSEDVGESAALLGEGIDDGCARRRQRGLYTASCVSDNP